MGGFIKGVSIGLVSFAAGFVVLALLFPPDPVPAPPATPATETAADEVPTTEAPATEAPTTEAPTTEAPLAQAPAAGDAGGGDATGAAPERDTPPGAEHAPQPSAAPILATPTPAPEPGPAAPDQETAPSVEALASGPDVETTSTGEAEPAPDTEPVSGTTAAQAEPLAESDPTLDTALMREPVLPAVEPAPAGDMAIRPVPESTPDPEAPAPTPEAPAAMTLSDPQLSDVQSSEPQAAEPESSPAVLSDRASSDPGPEPAGPAVESRAPVTEATPEPLTEPGESTVSTEPAAEPENDRADTPATVPAPVQVAPDAVSSDGPAAAQVIEAETIDTAAPEPMVEPTPPELPQPAPTVLAPTTTAPAAPAVERAQPDPEARPVAPDEPRLSVGDPAPHAGADVLPAPSPGVRSPSMPLVPLPGLNRVVEGVTVGRLPSIGAAPAPAETVPAVAPADDPDQPAWRRFAAAHDNPAGLPLFAVILIDAPADPGAEAAILGLPFAVSVALDPADPDAPRRAAAYRTAGHEVAILGAGLPAGATPADLDVTFDDWLRALPQAVALVDPPEGGFQADRALAQRLMPLLDRLGLGLVTLERGLNPAAQVARGAGIPDATVFRRLDAGDENAFTIRRYLDRATFRAQQEGRVAVMGRAGHAETIAGILGWRVEGRAGQVSLAPVSALMGNP